MSFCFHRAKKSKNIPFTSTDSPLLFIIYSGRDSKATTNQTYRIMSDISRIVGSVLHAKAIHVTNEAECGRRYGRNKSTKLVQGHVAQVHDGLSRTGRSQCFLTCDFDFRLGVSKWKKLSTRSVKPGPPPTAANSEIPAQNSQNSESKAADATEAAAANLKDAVNAIINPNVPTAPAAPSNYNYPTATNTTFDASLSLPTPTHCTMRWDLGPPPVHHPTYAVCVYTHTGLFDSLRA
jgi:hypothetical protein